MKKISFFFLLILLNSTCSILSAQDTTETPKTFKQQYLMTEQESNMLIDAEYFFEEGDYQRALPIYISLYQLFPGGTDYAYKTAICYLNSTGEKEKAIPYLEEVKEKAPKTKELDLHLGEAYYYSQHFEEAMKYFNKYLEEKPSKEKAASVKEMIQNYENAKAITKAPLDVTIENIGDPLNTEQSEFAPILSPDESTLIFTYVGDKSMGGLLDNKLKPDLDGTYYEDIFISHKQNGKWSEPESIGNNINTKGTDEALSLSVDGQHLFIYRHTKKNRGDIYMSSLEGGTWSTPKKLEGKINTKYWESNAFLSADGKTLYFSSDRPGGFGGKDIYWSEKDSSGKWGTPVNMGMTINTSANEDYPFVHPDGKILLFSSDGHNSMGGYDIFVSYREKQELFINYPGKFRWTKPQNIGAPINTSQNDIFYMLNADGSKAYFSSGRSGGIGQQDIYTVKPGIFERKPVLMVVKGKVISNGKPAEVKITVKEDGKSKPFDLNYKSNASTGNYFIYLPTDHNYTLSYEGQGLPSHTENINTVGIKSFTAKNIDLTLDTPEYLLAKADTVKSKKTELNTPDTLLAKAETPKEEKIEINTVNTVVAKKEPTTKPEVFKTDSLIAKESTKTTESVKIKMEEKIKQVDSLIAKTEVPKKEPAKKEIETTTTTTIAKKHMKVQRVYFDFNKTVLREEYKTYVDNVYIILKENKGAKVEIIGNTDSKGSDAYNMELARKRAKGIALYLENKGIEHNRIQLRSNGETKLLVSDQNADGSDNPTARAKNRRVEFKITTTDTSIEIEYEDNNPIEIGLP